MSHADSLPARPGAAPSMHAARGRWRAARSRWKLTAAALAGATILILGAQWPALGADAGLSPAARFDVLRRELNQSVREKKPEETLKVLERMRKLPQGVKGELLFFEGHAHYQLKHWDKAYRALVAYLNALGRKGRNYNLAITLFINTEKALKQARESETERDRARRGWGVAAAAYDRVSTVRNAWKEKAITFGGPKDDTAWAMARRAGGGFLVAGTFHQPEDKKKRRKDSLSMGLISLTRDGKMAWNRVILGTAEDGAIRSITALADGGFLVGGIHRGFQVAARLEKNAVPVPNHKGEPWIVPYARTGERAVPIVVRAADGMILALGAEDVVKDGKSARLPFAVRLSDDGQILGKTIYSGNAQRFWHAVNDAVALPGGDVIAAGEARAQAAWDTRKAMGFLMRITSAGRLVWARRIPAEDKSDIRFTAVVPATDGGAIVTGSKGNRLLVMKVDGDGRQSWAKTVRYRDPLPAGARLICPIPLLGERIKEAYAGTGRTLPNADRVAAVRAMSCPTGTPFISAVSIARRKEGYLVLGLQGRGERTHADIRLLALDEGGKVLWDRIYGHDGFEIATSALATEDGGMIIAGATDSVGAGGRDFLMFKVDRQGNFAPWTRLGPPEEGKPGPTKSGAAASAPDTKAETEAKPQEKSEGGDEAEKTPPVEQKTKPTPGESGNAPVSDAPKAAPKGEDQDSSDTSIGAIFGSIFGGKDPKKPQ